MVAWKVLGLNSRFFLFLDAGVMNLDSSP
jgi:hypothetical protein